MPSISVRLRVRIGGDFGQRLGQIVDSPGRVAIRTHAKRVGVLELEQIGDLVEERGDVAVVHAAMIRGWGLGARGWGTGGWELGAQSGTMRNPRKGTKGTSLVCASLRDSSATSRRPHGRGGATARPWLMAES